MPFTDYVGSASQTRSGQGSTGTVAGSDDKTEYWTLSKCKRAYTDYLGSKRAEIDEQKNARRYRHGAHWTAAQIKTFNDRKQPVVTYNRIGRKIDGIVGLVEKLRQDPKAFPRTPKHEQGAELATAVLNFVLDQQDWKAKSPICAENGAVDGIGGIELTIVPGPNGDNEIDFDTVDIDGFFYDPRSFRLDFTDARYQGQGKWVDLDTAKEMVPDKADQLEAVRGDGSDLTSNSDRDNKWFSETGEVKRIRLVDIWYKHKGGWCWCLFTGQMKLSEGRSPFLDEKDKEYCKFIMFSAAVDHDGDRYGFVRNLKSANDEINQRRSKGLHELNTRRIIGEHGAFDDVELARREAARPDGMVLRNPGFNAEFDDTARLANIEGQFKFLEDAKAEIENFGPNPALIGQGIENKSGRAIALLQQAGIAELGPYILAYRGWKIRVYRAIWNAVQRHWTGERWVRVTDDEDVAQFIQVNGMGTDPQTGQPAIVNALGQLDVDIILDEGPDHVNMMADAYDTLTVLAGQGANIPPQVLIELSPLASSVKRKVMDMLNKPDPMTQQAKQIALAGEGAKVDETKSKTLLNIAKAHGEGMPDSPQAQPQEFELPPQVQVAQALADIDETRASAASKRAQAGKFSQEAFLAPIQAAQDAFDAGEDRKAAARQPSQS